MSVAAPAQPVPIRSVRLTPFQERLLADGADCAHCPLSRNGLPRPNAVPTEWNGQGSPLVALVGEAPGRRETQMGRPFVGPSGKMLDYTCQQAGIPRRDLAIMNAAACGPIPSEAQDIKDAATAACRPRLLTELRRLQPAVVTAIGSQALKVLAPANSSGVTVLRGALLDLAHDVVGLPPLDGSMPWRPAFFSTFHPAHILRGGDGDAPDVQGGGESSAVDLLYYFFLYDLVKAYRYARGQMKVWEDDLDLFVDVGGGRLYRAGILHDGSVGLGDAATGNDFLDSLARVRDEARQWGKYALDVETDSKDSLDALMTSIAFATPLGGVAASWPAFLNHPRALKLIKEELTGDARLWADIHNRIYDIIVCDRHGIPILGPVDDTLLKHHAAFPGLPHKLQQVATQFIIAPPWKDEFRQSTRDVPSLVLYNGRDTLATARIDPVLDNCVNANGAGKVYEVDRQLAAIATRMRQVGFWIDERERVRHETVQTARLKAMQEELTRDFAALEQPWRERLARNLAQKQRKHDPESYIERVKMRFAEIPTRDRKPTDIGLFKPKAKADIVALFEILRIPFTKYTKKGNPVTDKQAMEAAGSRHPLMRRLIHLREAQHLIATYLNLPRKADGRFHPDWRTTKITGRWSAGKSQNWPNNVAGWPPERNPDGTVKKTEDGAIIVPRENLRSIVAAPTVEEILALSPFDVDPQILRRAREGSGRLVTGADFDQQELRIAGFLSRDPFLLKAYQTGLDVHSYMSRLSYGEVFPALEDEFKRRGLKPKVDLDALALDEFTLFTLRKTQKQWKYLRDLTKRIEYGTIYGAEDITLYNSAVKMYPQVTLGNIRAAKKVIEREMAGVVRWRNQMEVVARRDRGVREFMFGRMRLFPLGNFNASIVFNFPIQAFGASLKAVGMLRFTAMVHPELLQLDRLIDMGIITPAWLEQARDEKLDEWHAPVELVLDCHDSLLAEHDEEDAKKCERLMEFAMDQTIEDTDGTTMRFPAEAKAARCWSKT